MARIIAGVFETMTEAERTREALVEAGFADGDMTSFFNNAPGQHGELATGGDEAVDPGAQGLQKGTAAGAAAGAGIGLAAGLTAGPAAIAVAGVGAFVGALAGTGSAAEDRDTRMTRRPAGVMVAVHTADANAENRAIRVLRERGAQNIERADGIWENGDWADFNATAEPLLVDQQDLHVTDGPRKHDA